MKTTSLALLAAFVLLPGHAFAADVPVTYTVAEKPLKAGVTGTPLTFVLYGDHDCTSFVYSVVVPVEDVTLMSKLKQFTPKKAAKLPNTVELRTTVAGVPPASSLYLKVTAAGGLIVPVGGECQAQASSAAGPTGSSLVLEDSTGAVVGPYFDEVVYLSFPDGLVRAPETLLSGESWFFSHDLDNCGGSTFGPASASSSVGVRNAFARKGGDLYYATGPVRHGVVSTESGPYPGPTCPTSCELFIPPSTCCKTARCIGFGDELGSALGTKDVSGFVAPFHVELR